MTTVAALALALPLAPGLMSSGESAHPVAPRNKVYKVYYWNVNKPNQLHLYGTYNSYAQALNAMHFLNSFPEYVAYLE